jgi:hypothetical protein
VTDRLSILRHLRARLAGSTGPDSGVDLMLECHLMGAFERPWGPGVRVQRGDGRPYNAPGYTRSFEEAVRLWPEQASLLTVTRLSETRWVVTVRIGGKPFRVEAPTAALALCLARVHFEVEREEATV